MLEAVKRLEALLPEMIQWRRHLHRHPELSFQEARTAQFIADRLREWGIEVRSNVGGHGILGFIRGEKPGRTVALRADIDALPIQDEKECAYASTVQGIMHACGHDAHTAALLGAAKWLSDHRRRWSGRVVLLFQPAEEMSPGGAAPMIRDGALDGVDAIYGVHLWTPFPVGHVYSAPGPIMAAADEFGIGITGRGGHGGLPHETIDSIMAGAQLIVNLQPIVSRMIDPVDPCVVSIGSLHAGSSFNAIAELCSIKGTVRTFRTEVQQKLKARIERVVRHTCAAFGASYRFDYKEGYPPVVNDARETERFFEVGEALFGADRVHRCPLMMAGEDFSYYLQKVPGCFMFVGAGNEKTGAAFSHHHPKFDIDETAMLHAARLLTHMALDALR